MGKGGGKSKGKIVFSVIGLAIGAWGANFAMFGTTSVFSSAMFGASIASTLWSVTNKQDLYGNLNSDYSQDDYSRFNTVTNDVNQNACIPVIYGTRKYGGLQVWHNPYNGNRYLQKDVIICESGIEGVYNVCANEELIKSDTNISIYNIQHKDATVQRVNKSTLRLYAGGKTQDYTLGNTDSYNAQTSLLNTVIDKIKSEAGNGWKIDGAVDDRTSKGISANTLEFNSFSSCYVDPEDIERKGSVVLDTRGYAIGTYAFNNGTTPDNYNDVGGYPQCAWIRSDLIASSRLSGSNPTINAYIKGMKVAVWKNNKWSVEYSENPAWIIRDFLLSKHYGTGNWITEDILDEDSFREVANYCDEQIGYVDFNGEYKTTARYKLNIILDSQKSPLEHLSSMLAVFGGFLTIGKQIALKVEKAETPVYAFDDNTIIKDSMSIGQTSLEETPNRYKIGYFDPNQEWTEVKVVVEDLELQHEREGKITEKIVTLAGCTSQNQALRIGRLYRDLNKVCSLTISFSVATQGMMLECGDVITVTYGGIFQNMPVRITQIDETNAGVYQLTCRQYNETIYNDELGASIVNPNYANTKNPIINGVPVPENLELVEDSYVNADGSIRTGVVASWDIVDCSSLFGYQVSISTDGKNYEGVGSTYDNRMRIPNLKIGTQYYVAVQALAYTGLSSSIVIGKITLVGKNAPPEQVSNLLVTESLSYKGKISISWDDNVEPDISHYLVSIGDMNYKVIDNHIDIQLQESDEYTISVTAVDTSGNMSSPVTQKINVICEPSDVPNVEVSQKNADKSVIQISWDSIKDIDLNAYEIRIGEKTDTWESSSLVTRTRATSCEYTLKRSGVYKVMVSAINNSGFYSINPVYIIKDLVIEPSNVSMVDFTQKYLDRAVIQISWSAITDSDIDYYEVRITNDGTWNDGKCISKLKGTNIEYELTESANCKVMVKAVNVSGAYSVLEASRTKQVILEPDAVTNLTLKQSEKDRSEFYLSWLAPYGGDIKGYIINITNKGNKIVSDYLTTETDYKFNISESGYYDISVKALTISGFESNSATIKQQCSIEPSDISGLTITQSLTSKSQVTISWDLSNSLDIVGYEVREGDSWDFYNTLVGKTSDNKITVNVNKEGQYTWWVVAIAKSGKISQYPQSVTAVLDLQPSMPTNINIIQDINDASLFTVTFDAINDVDLAYYEIRLGDSWDDSELLTTSQATSYQFRPVETSGYIKVMVKARNTSGYYSNELSQTMYAVLEPVDVSMFYAYQNGEYVQFVWNPPDTSDIQSYEIREGDSFNTGTLVGTNLMGTSYKIQIDFDGDYTYWIKAINRIGKYSINAIKSSVNVINLPEKNIILTKDVLSMKDGYHNNTSFGQSEFSFATLGGTFADKENLRFDDIGGSNVLILATDSNGKYYPTGTYTSKTIDVGTKLSAKIAIKFKSTSVINSEVSARLQARFSVDGVNWTEWRDFQPSEYVLRYIEVRVILSTQNTSQTPEVNFLIVYIDMPDVEKIGSINVPVGGISIEYDKPFYIVPITTATAIGEDIRCEVTEPSKERFYLKVIEVSTGQDVGGNVDWRSRGY